MMLRILAEAPNFKTRSLVHYGRAKLTFTSRRRDESITGNVDCQEMHRARRIGLKRLPLLPHDLIRSTGVHVTGHIPDIFQ